MSLRRQAPRYLARSRPRLPRHVVPTDMLRALQRAADLPQLCASLQAHLPRLVAHDWAALMLENELTASVCWSATNDTAVPHLDALPQAPTARLMAFESCAAASPTIRRWLERNAAPGGRFAVLPLRWEGGAASLWLASHHSAAWTPDEQQMLLTCGVALELGLERVAANRAVRAAREREALLGRLLSIINSVDTDAWQTIWTELAAQLGRLLSADHCVLCVAHSDLDTSMITWSADGSAVLGDALQYVPASSYDAGRVGLFTQGITLSASDLQALPRPYTPFQQLLVSSGVAAFVAVPVLVDGTFAAALGLCQNRAWEWSADEIGLVEMIAQHLAVALRQSRLHSREVQRRREFEIAHQTAIEVNSHHDLPVLLQTMVERACALLGAAHGAVYLLDESAGEVEVRYGHNMPPDLIGIRFPVEQGLVGEAICERTIKLVPHYSGWEYRQPAFEFTNFGGVACVPLITQNRVLGALALAHVGGKNTFDAGDLRVVELVAAQAAQAVVSAQLVEQVQRNAADMEAVYANALSLTTPQAPQSILESIVVRAMNLTQAAAAGIHRVDDESQDLILTFGVNVPDYVGTRVRMGEGIAGRVAQQRQSILLDSYQSWETPAAVYADGPWFAVLCVPLLSGERVLGVLGLAHTDPARSFSTHDQRLMELFAAQGAQAVDLALRLDRERELRAGAQRSLQELQLVMRELEQANEHMSRVEKARLLGELASEVAHDFNNALLGILGNTQLLLLDENSDDRREMLAAIESAARDSTAMVQRIQEFGRAPTANVLEPLSINELIDDVVSMTQPRWRDRIRLSLALEATAPVLGNAADLRRVLMNLVINALDAMPGDGVLALRTVEERGQARIEVADTGVGMSAAVQARIFDPFYTTKAAGKGSGLGLSICQQLVARHGGTIDVCSAPGRGTTFTVLLPTVSGVGTATGVRPAAESPRALVCEPDALRRGVLDRFLEQQGCVVDSVATACAAAQHLAARSYDLTVVDAAALAEPALALLRPRLGFTIAVAEAGASVDGVDGLLARPVELGQLHAAVFRARHRH